MSHVPESRHAVSIPSLQQMVAEGRRIVMVTAYDAATARIADAAEMDIILVGDSVGNVCLGFENTLPVSMAMMNHHLEAVARTRPRALLMADMPYLSFHVSLEESIRNAGGFIQRGAQAVKLEGGAKRLPVVHALLDAEIPVMAHLGLTPQSLHAMGGYRVQGKAEESACAILDDALRMQDAGCFGVLLEGVPAELAQRVTESLSIPTIGIGAGPHCSGQVLVFHDVLGILPGHGPKFVRSYLDGFTLMRDALKAWGADVREGSFPGPEESYTLPKNVQKALDQKRPPETEP
jgi:3-methyl-2-oxobutanoate hydroxymethyltransferase